MFFTPLKIATNPNAEASLAWSVIAGTTSSTLGLNKNVGLTIIDGSDPNAYPRSTQAYYCYTGRLVAVRRLLDDLVTLANIVDFYDEDGRVVKTLDIGQDPVDIVSDWTLDLDNNIYTVGNTPNAQVVRTDFGSNTKTFINLTVPVSVSPVLDPEYIAFVPTDGLIIAEATRDPDTTDENLYVFSTNGAYAQSRRIGSSTAALGLVHGDYNIFVNYNGSDTEFYLLNGLAPLAGWPKTYTALNSDPNVAINQNNEVFIHDGVLEKFDSAGNLLVSKNTGISNVISTMHIDQFNNIFITDFNTGTVIAYNQSDLSTKWTRSISDVTTTVADYLPIGYKTNWDGGFPVSYDPDAQAFFTAAGITDTTQKNATNQLVLDLKSANIWNKMQVIYPFVGGTATAHKYNLKDPQDTDAAYRLDFTNITHSAAGAAGNASGCFGDTHWIPNNQTFTNGVHWSANISVESVTASQYNMGIAQAGDWALINDYGGNQLDYWSSGAGGYLTASTASGTGFTLGTSNGSNNRTLYVDGISAASDSTGTISTSQTIPAYLWAVNDNGSAVGQSFDTIDFATIGEYLTATEVTALNTAQNTFNAALGR